MRRQKMASLTQRKGSPYWHIQIKENGRWVRQRTALRLNSTAETRKAQQLVARYARDERALPGAIGGMAWDDWVESFFQLRYADRPRTLQRFMIGWVPIRLFLRERQLRIPSEVRREDCFEYVL